MTAPAVGARDDKDQHAERFAARLAAADWDVVAAEVNDYGCARDHTGGEFLLVEQRPRAQSRGTATLVPLGRGLVFTTRDRPVRSARGWSAAPVRHGVSVVRSGRRHTLGLVFHDAG